METITIEYGKLIEVLTSAYIRAEGFDWSGWRLPIYTNPAGEIRVGGWMSNNSWQPDEIELPVRVEKWELPEDADIQYEAEKLAQVAVQQFDLRIHAGETWGRYEFLLVEEEWDCRCEFDNTQEQERRAELGAAYFYL